MLPDHSVYSPSSQTAYYTVGDIDGDGTVGLEDVQALYQIVKNWIREELLEDDLYYIYGDNNETYSTLFNPNIYYCSGMYLTTNSGHVLFVPEIADVNHDNIISMDDVSDLLDYYSYCLSHPGYNDNYIGVTFSVTYLVYDTNP